MGYSIETSSPGYKRRATLAMSYCEGWNRDPGKMAGEWSRDYRGFSALIPRFFYTPGGRSIPPLADFWIRHAIPAAWNLYLISSFFFSSSLLFRVAIEFVLNYDLVFSSSNEDEIVITSVMKIDNLQCVSLSASILRNFFLFFAAQTTCKEHFARSIINKNDREITRSLSKN